MKKIAILFVLFTQLSIAQVSRNLGDFNALKVFDRINVELIPSDQNRIEISGNRSSEVEIVNNNGELKIRMPLKKLLNGEDINAKVYYRELNSIDASEGAIIEGAQTMTQTAMNLNAKEGGQIRLNLEVKKIDVRMVTGGIIKLNGSADSMDVNIGTGGILEAKNFVTSHTDIDIKAGGEAEINVTDTVDADIKAGGNIDIYGHPKHVSKSTKLGGSIDLRD